MKHKPHTIPYSAKQTPLITRVLPTAWYLCLGSGSRRGGQKDEGPVTQPCYVCGHSAMWDPDGTKKGNSPARQERLGGLCPHPHCV